MFRDKKVTAILVAAGSGKRFGSELPKQYLSLNGRTVLEEAAAKFQESELVDEIIAVAGHGYLDLASGLLSGFGKFRTVTEGGAERQDSVLAGLKLTDPGIVLIHDAARPFVTREIIERVTEEAEKSGAAIPCVKVKDTIRTPEETLDRSRLYSVQTPQGFHTGLIREAYQKAFGDGFRGTDDASLVERLGHPVALVEGGYANCKITTKEDLKHMEYRTGTGFDVHRLTEGRKCILMGVDIPFEKGLLGHSDADVAVHALMDAMLGAAALGDIGRHFPDHDPAYEGISSIELLRKVTSLISDAGYSVVNADVTVICERPKIAPYMEEMRRITAEAMGIAPDRLNIKGTTTEGLGFPGRQEGIAAQAVCTLSR